jgi:hypothetical protein
MPARLVILAFLALAALAQPASTLFKQVDEMVMTLSGLTGWQIRERVPSEMLSNDRFRHLVEDGIKKESHEKDIRAEEITLKMFGFVPQDFDLKQEAVDLVSEQAAAFYDYRKKRLFVLDSTPEGIERQVALVHELAHALADQHHHLGKYLTHGSPDDDASTARQAVMEGQATWLSWAYVSKHNGGKGEVPASVIEELTRTTGAEGSEFPVFSSAPLYVRESLVFPYDEGLKFQDAVFHKLGRPGFDEVFTRPPVSTQQILHPEAYFENKKPTDPDPPSATETFGKDASHYRELGEGTLGEFDYSVLFRQYIGETEGADAASHLRGGSYRLYENKREKYPVLTNVSEWDSKESAQAAFQMYSRVLKAKWKKMEVTAQSDGEVSGVGDSGRFRLWLDGMAVQSVEGLR